MTNMSGYERIFRIIVGLTLISMAFFGPENLWFLLGLFPLLTGLYGWCFFYKFFGITTCDFPNQSDRG